MLEEHAKQMRDELSYKGTVIDDRVKTVAEQMASVIINEFNPAEQNEIVEIICRNVVGERVRLIGIKENEVDSLKASFNLLGSMLKIADGTSK